MTNLRTAAEMAIQVLEADAINIELMGGNGDHQTKTIEALRQALAQDEQVSGDTSDGYHTFNELYDFRKAYNAALFNEWAASGKYSVHKSKRHYDGKECFGGGWFIVVAQLPNGQISNHYEMKDWDKFQLPEADKALFEYDNHTGADVLHRLFSLQPFAQPDNTSDSAKHSADSAESFCKQELHNLMSVAGRMALELECLLLDTENLSVVSKWWDTGMEALQAYRHYVWSVTHGKDCEHFCDTHCVHTDHHPDCKIGKQQALNKKDDNAGELGLDYELSKYSDIISSGGFEPRNKVDAQPEQSSIPDFPAPFTKADLDIYAPDSWDDERKQTWIDLQVCQRNKIQLHKYAKQLRELLLAQPEQEPVEPPSNKYNSKRIAWELERTAMGDGYYGNALYVAMDMPQTTRADREMLNRYMHGSNLKTDHVKLQDLAMRIYTALEQPEQEPVAWQVMVENEPMKEFSIKDMAHDWAVAEKRNGSKYSYWIRPLYTAPPKREWQGLTDDDWHNLSSSDKKGCERDAEIFDWIEAKLKEKNGYS